MRLVLLGPQGSGKGTQAELISKRTGARHIAMGDIVRAEIRAGTSLGQVLRGFSDRGELVPDETILELIRPAVQQSDSWILDGFPRDRTQAEALDEVLRDEGWRLDRVVVLVMEEEAVLDRLGGRRQSESTGEIYHIVYNPPPPNDPGPFLVRADDQPEAIQRRLQLYHTLTEPLTQFYNNQGLLVRVDADGSINEVRDRLLQALHR